MSLTKYRVQSVKYNQDRKPGKIRKDISKIIELYRFGCWRSKETREQRVRRKKKSFRINELAFTMQLLLERIKEIKWKNRRW